MKRECQESVKYVKVGNYTKYCIDMLPLRHHVKKEKMLIAGLHNRTTSKHIHGVDAYDKSRQLSAMNKIQLAPKYVTTWYAIIDNKKVLLSKYIKKLQHYHIKYILDTKINKKIYVNGKIYDLKYTTAR